MGSEGDAGANGRVNLPAAGRDGEAAVGEVARAVKRLDADVIQCRRVDARR